MFFSAFIGEETNYIRWQATFRRYSNWLHLDTRFQKYVTGRNIGRGSGLGLVFCRLAVEAHGGRIWVDSEAGHGTTFIFQLPFAPS